ARRSGGSLIAADIALLAVTALVRSLSALRKNRRRRDRLHQQDRDSSKHNAMDLSHAPPSEIELVIWAQPPALTSRHCRHHFGGERRRAEIANIRVGQLADPASHQLDQIENEIGGS